MQITKQKIETLDCYLASGIAPGQDPQRLVVLSHGYGAAGSDLLDFAPWLAQFSREIGHSCQFAFPEAPVDLAPIGMPGGRAWWPINMARLAEINQTQDFDELTQLTPEGMTDASLQLASLIRSLQKRFSLDDDRTIIGGFSQGAMVSADVVLRQRVRPELLALFSGTLLCRDDWRQLAGQHHGCQVLQSHGRQDLVLPLQPARQLQQMLTENGFSVEFHEFAGGHTIPMPVLQRFGEILRANVARSDDGQLPVSK